MRSKLHTFLCLMVVLALVAGAQATTAIRLSNESMTDQSDLIVIGRAGDVRSEWVGRELVTLVTVSVTEVVKGDAGSEITVVTPGGIDASREIKIAMSFPAAPTMSPNEEVFLFLTPAGDEFGNGYAIIGWSQGKFSIVEDAQGQKFVSRDLTDLKLADATGANPGGMSRNSLKSFKAEIAGYAKGGTQ